MSNLRDEILQWAASGLLKPENVPRAMQMAGATPRVADWRRFVQSLLLWTGVVLTASGVIFFFAYNWSSMHRYSKFALAEILFVGTLLAAWRLGVESAAGKGALTGTALLTGALLALFGQTYQTGADVVELFGTWALLILPWVIVGRFAPLWLLWVCLLDICAALYFQTVNWGLLGLLFGMSGSLWTVLAVNVIALVAWEAALANGVSWLDRWGARVLATLAGGAATILGVVAIAGSREVGDMGIVANGVWIAATYAYYRHKVLDVFMLSGAVLSAIIATTIWLGRHLLRHSSAGGFLLIGLVIIGLSGAAAWWIREILREQPE